MNKTELAYQIANKANLSNAQAGAAVDAFVHVVGDVLKKGGKIVLVGFGTFQLSERNARTARNPRTGESIKIEAKKVVRFKPGKALAESVS